MDPENDATPMQNSATNKTARVAILSGHIRPTAMERLHGRLMRAPDHDAGTGGAPATPAPADPAAPATPPAGDPPADPAPGTPPADGSKDEGETSLLGGAAAPKPAAGDPPADPNANPEDPKPGEERPAAGDPVVPETYELKVEGMDLDPAAIEEATPIFKEAGLTNEQAQKIMPAAAKFRDSVANQTLQQLVDAGAKQKSDWADATKADPDIGGAKLEETLHLSAKALDALGYPEGSEFRKVLTETGFGNHPEMVRMMRKIGEMASEDGFPRSGADPATPLSVEKRMYPND